MIVAISVKAGEIDARVRRFDPVMEDAGRVIYARVKSTWDSSNSC